jgi:2-aminoadipate transaminase
MVEEYGRAGHFDTGVPRAQALYASHWAALSASLSAHMPDGVEWSEPTGGMFTWLELPEGLDALALRDAATEAGVAYVPGAPFYAATPETSTLRLCFVTQTPEEIAEGLRRLGTGLRG